MRGGRCARIGTFFFFLKKILFTCAHGVLIGACNPMCSDPFTRRQVCLPPPTAPTNPAEDGAGPGTPLGEELGHRAGSATLTVDGAAVSGVVEGRMLCAPTNLTGGEHSVVRR